MKHRERYTAQTEDYTKRQYEALNAIIKPVTGLIPEMLPIINAFLTQHILVRCPALLLACSGKRDEESLTFWDPWDNISVAIVDNAPTSYLKDKAILRRQITIHQYKAHFSDITSYQYCTYCSKQAQTENKDGDNEIWHSHRGYCCKTGTCKDCRCCIR